MTQEQRINVCNECEHKKMDWQSGLLCGLTNAKADFELSCDNFSGNASAVAQPIDKGSEAFKILEQAHKKALRAKGTRDMIFGAMWCIGGTIATVADIGYIFWGAILFGGIQFIKGLVTLASA